jgi:hypothetical protein
MWSAAMDVGDWLKGIGLGQYESTKRQETRSFELRAALSLAKLYQSTGRLADAHAVLAPALEGFSPTPEMPEIAEAEELLAALAQWSARNGSARR